MIFTINYNQITKYVQRSIGYANVKIVHYNNYALAPLYRAIKGKADRNQRQPLSGKFLFIGHKSAVNLTRLK